MKKQCLDNFIDFAEKNNNQKDRLAMSSSPYTQAD
jgi:hypothetical protein